MKGICVRAVKPKFLRAFVVALLPTVFAMPSALADDNATIAFGAYRWDAYHGGTDRIYTDTMRTMSPEKWRYRLPFYAKVHSDGTIEANAATQEIMDREIGFARSAGLDFWVFLYYAAYGDDYCMNQSLQLYLKSKRRAEISFCLQLTHLPDRHHWAQFCDKLVTCMKEPGYQTVREKRPVLMFYRSDLKERFGSWEAAKDSIALLRDKCGKAGLPSPYIVISHYDSNEQEAAVKNAGCDAITDYTLHRETGKDENRPYSHLAASNLAGWEAWRSLGCQMIPCVNAGWDKRPIFETPTFWYKPQSTGTWWTEPTPDEFADNCQAAVDWCHAHPDETRPGLVLIYAWNEWMEGGYILPTLRDGNVRLQALRRVRRGNPADRPARTLPDKRTPPEIHNGPKE